MSRDKGHLIIYSKRKKEVKPKFFFFSEVKLMFYSDYSLFPHVK